MTKSIKSYLSRLSSQSSISKRTILIGALVILSAVATVGIFTALEVSNKDDESTQKAVPAPGEIIKKYTNSSSILDKDSYITRQNMAASTAINYQLDGKFYSTNLSSVDHIQYDRKDKSIIDNSASLKSSTEAFLIDLGMIKKSDTGASSYELITYDSKETVCQINDTDAFSGQSASYGLSCVSHDAINVEYSAIDKLLDLYAKTDHKKDDINRAIRSTIVENNKTLSMLDIIRTDGKPMTTLIFAAIDDQWEYIGERASPSANAQESLESSSKLKEAVNNPKYDGFLAKYIQ